MLHDGSPRNQIPCVWILFFPLIKTALTEVLRADEKVVLKAAVMVVSMAALVVTLRALLMFLGFLYVPWLHLQSWLHPDFQWFHPNLSAAGLILTHQ